MKRFFSIDNGFSRFMNTLWDLALLNLLYLLSCIPLVTIGAATTALHRVALRIRRDDYSLFRDYWRSFRENFRQATLLFLFLLLLFVIVAADLFLVAHLQTDQRRILMIPFLAIALLLLSIRAYAFPLLSQFQNTNRQILKNAAILSIRYLYWTIPMLVLNLLPLAVALISLNLFVTIGYIWFLLYFSLSAYLQAFLLDRVFTKLMPCESAEPREEPSV